MVQIYNGLSPGRRQAIIWTNAGILLIGPWGKNFSEILIGIQTFSFKKMPLKMSSAKRRPFCLGLNVIMGKGNCKTRPETCLGIGCILYKIIDGINFQTDNKDRYLEHFQSNCLQIISRMIILSTLVQVVAWCRQATSHYRSQCWSSSMSPYDIARTQWIIMNTVFLISGG